MRNQSFIVVCGPTGVGKSDLVGYFSHHLPIEVINGDMGQLYCPLSIGTAKPKLEKEKAMHHMFDIIDEPRFFSAMEYRERVQEKMQEVWERNALPVIVGGSFFYLKSLFFELFPSCPATLSDYSSHTNEDLWNMLNDVDPLRAQMIHINDRYRLERAISIWHSTHTKPSLYTPRCKPVGKQGLIIFVQRERAELYQRINTRTIDMFKEGWVEEVSSLSPAWHEFLLEKKILGYDVIVQSLRKQSLSATKEDQLLMSGIQQKTRNYAKRQITFWNSFKKMVAMHAEQSYNCYEFHATHARQEHLIETIEKSYFNG